MAVIIFSHGKESTPNSTKIAYLSQIAQGFNFKTISIDYTHCVAVNERVRLLRDIVRNYESEPIILVGSSMGGYVSTVIACERSVNGLFLMAPAFYLANYDQQEFFPKNPNIEIVHGWQDEVVPYQNSIKFGNLTLAKLHLIDDNHRLSNSYDFLSQIFKNFLRKIADEHNV
ncbi:YqiA/YcfP family alpha/beta fold hydrolase [Aureispira anguillae]|uniref:Alpha/beta hydrolase n=1 Tax=Aureispira anguillae TaxID=2864201 RepID=A0A915YLF5_9BACT|nr:YqiA/YcfP family alpha/beta fold hydrolase [Aureispira anguillae]BDS15388.1 alpha/beta hydrolase [Aureispira anguillae]